MTLDELYGTLVSYEMNYLEDEAPKSVTLNAEDLEMIESDEEMALLSRKLSRMISEKRAAKLKFGKFHNRNSYQDEVHPVLNENGESAGGDEHTENHEVVAFMANADESSDENEESSSKTTDESRKLDVDELTEAYEEMVFEQKKDVKNKELLDTIYRLEDQNEKLEDELEKLMKITYDKSSESERLNSENLKLKDENDRLRKGKEKLDEVLSIGKPFGDHKGLGFCESSQKTKFKEEQKQKQKQNRRRIQDDNSKLSQPTDCKYCMYPGYSAVKCLKLAKDVVNGRHIQMAY
ncbi:uncharacterized protein LOC127255835 [Andrographis paniculata]|uniref:uncharacterized protein LOC127255835 n=1 Tax=Andrographis paniculata TaxID=175694 RepID=UPI0021E8817D|nr:uncharacterized protein LOC127255835 [Andrographis paniculata]